MKKRAYSVQMNLDVPESEKQIAEKAYDYFDNVISSMQKGVDYLNYIYIPFSKYQNIDMDTIIEYRKTFREYKDEVKKKFDNILMLGYRAVALMSEFKADNSVEEIIDSFLGSMNELDKYIDTFTSIFSNLNDPQFRKNLLSTIDAIKKQVSQIRNLINDRVLDHIDKNILAKDWTSDFSDRFNETVEDNVPLVVKLFEERQKALNQG